MRNKGGFGSEAAGRAGEARCCGTSPPAARPRPAVIPCSGLKIIAGSCRRTPALEVVINSPGAARAVPASLAVPKCPPLYPRSLRERPEPPLSSLGGRMERGMRGDGDGVASAPGWCGETEARGGVWGGKRKRRGWI